MSQLVSIIQRLQTMQNNGDQEDVPQRLFEVNQKVLCQVKYFPASHTYEVEEYSKDIMTSRNTNLMISTWLRLRFLK